MDAYRDKWTGWTKYWREDGSKHPSSERDPLGQDITLRWASLTIQSLSFERWAFPRDKPTASFGTNSRDRIGVAWALLNTLGHALLSAIPRTAFHTVCTHAQACGGQGMCVFETAWLHCQNHSPVESSSVRDLQLNGRNTATHNFGARILFQSLHKCLCSSANL